MNNLEKIRCKAINNSDGNQCSFKAVIGDLCMKHWRIKNLIHGTELKREMHPVGSGIGMEKRYYHKIKKGGRL